VVEVFSCVLRCVIYHFIGFGLFSDPSSSVDICPFTNLQGFFLFTSPALYHFMIFSDLCAQMKMRSCIQRIRIKMSRMPKWEWSGLMNEEGL
jgi:hypothetical protein